jgi:hypothetical protein
MSHAAGIACVHSCVLIRETFYWHDQKELKTYAGYHYVRDKEKLFLK